MPANPIIRKTQPDDLPALQALYETAFAEEDVFPLVAELLRDAKQTLHLSAWLDSKLVGHITFTHCHASPQELPLALLGPMAVLPDYQKQGIGSQLIQEGITLLREQAVAKLLVLGDPNYYGRAGFTEEPHIKTPYPIPAEWKSAWQSLALIDGGAKASGALFVPTPWQRPELWAE
jgi:putative acetyltransferase